MNEFFKTHKYWIVAQAIAVLAVAGAWVWDIGEVSASVRASANTAALQQDLQQRVVEAAALPTTQREIEKLKYRLGLLSDRVPEASERNDTVKTLFELMSGVRGVSVLEVTSPVEKLGEEGLVHVVREASFRGDFLDLGRLVEKVEGLGFVVGVTNLKLERDPLDPQVLVLTLDLSLPFQR